LAQLRLAFRVEPSGYHEPSLAVSPIELVRTHAYEKAWSVTPTGADGPVLGVDTAVITNDGVVLGKPADRDQARVMLGQLAGSCHTVASGVALRCRDATRVAHAETRVWFRSLSDPQISAYLDAGEWRERAGGYAIQGFGAALVTRVDGCYENVVGLPVALLISMLEDAGYHVL
jgi:septum formation protein